MRRHLAYVALLFAFIAQPASAACTYRPFECDTHINERLENATCSFSGQNWPYHIYSMDLVAGTVLDVFLESSAFPPRVAIYEGSNAQSSAHADGSTITSLTFSVPRSGRYWVLATSTHPGYSSGLFRLDVYCDFVCLKPDIASSTVPTISVPYGGTASMAVSVDGSPTLRYRWYSTENTSVTLGTTGPSFTSAPLFASTTFAVTVSNDCGEASRTVAIVQVSPCAAPTITEQPKDVHATTGSLATFTVIASGSGAAYRWYEGVPSDTSHPVGTPNSQQLLIFPVVRSSTYFARVSTACGYSDSRVAVLDVASSRHRAVRK